MDALYSKTCRGAYLLSARLKDHSHRLSVRFTFSTDVTYLKPQLDMLTTVVRRCEAHLRRVAAQLLLLCHGAGVPHCEVSVSATGPYLIAHRCQITHTSPHRHGADATPTSSHFPRSNRTVIGGAPNACNLQQRSCRQQHKTRV